jgi:hypothetical protein
MASLRAASDVPVDPVFVDPDSGLLMVMEPEILIGLKDGVDPAAFFGAEWPRVSPLPGTRNQFVLSAGDLTAEKILADCVRRSADDRVAWPSRISAAKAFGITRKRPPVRESMASGGRSSGRRGCRDGLDASRGPGG